MYKGEPYVASDVGFDWKLEALYEALWKSWNEVIQSLMRRGVNIYERSSRTDVFVRGGNQKSTTLQTAIEWSEKTVITSLLDKSLQRSGLAILPGLTDSNIASADGHNLYLNATDDRHRSALHYLLRRDGSRLKDSEAIMAMLLQNGADPNIISDDGETVLHVAAAIGSEEVLQSLRNGGLDFEAENKTGAKIIHFGAGGSSPTICRYLMRCGMDPLARDQDGRTPLHYAAAAGNVSGLETLIHALQGVDDVEQAVAGLSSQERLANPLQVVDVP